MNKQTFSLLSILFAAFAVMSAGGCQQDEIRSYTVPRIAKKGLQYEVPPTWEKFVNPGQFATAKYLVKGKTGKDRAEFSISAFPGLAGGVLDNVNRWRKQVKLEPHQDAAELAKNMKELKVAGKTAYYVDLQGPVEAGETRILGVILNTENKTWFFKLTGPKNLLESEKPRFEAVMKTVSFGDNDGNEP